MKIVQTPTFGRAVKKLHTTHKKELDNAIRAIMAAPLEGDAKVGDICGIRVSKFRMNKQVTLLAYSYREKPATLTLLALGSHENFYRDLKK
ncbi:MAG: type II toxin-antitoxin system RelE/ParE family toxin [Alphaproteobacteria bacterium]